MDKPTEYVSREEVLKEFPYAPLHVRFIKAPKAEGGDPDDE